MRQLEFGQQLKVGSYSVSLTFIECLKIFGRVPSCYLVEISESRVLIARDLKKYREK